MVMAPSGLSSLLQEMRECGDATMYPAVTHIVLTLTGIGVTWLYGFDFEIKVIAKLPEASAAAG